MDLNLEIEKKSYTTWTCPHCGSVWSYDLDKNKACDSFLCHGTGKPYVIIFDRALCLCCEGKDCMIHWRNWNRQRITSETPIPQIYAKITFKDESHQTCAAR